MRALPLLLSRLLGSDFHGFPTGAGLSPSPARFGFPETITLFVIAFVPVNIAIIVNAFSIVKIFFVGMQGKMCYADRK